MAIVILPLIIVTSYEYVKIRKPISAVFKTLSRPFKKKVENKIPREWIVMKSSINHHLSIAPY